MKISKRVIAYAVVLCLGIVNISSVLASEQSAVYPNSVFSTPSAVEVSELSYVDEVNVGGVNVKNVHAVLLDGLPYKGSDTQIFAYWGMPDNIPQGEEVPGVVLVHGGGGTAFADWVQRWNDKGYAAIAIYWGEEESLGRDPAVPSKYSWNIGPRINGGFNDISQERSDQWMYHAVSKAIIANSFLRAQPGVDADKVGICGVSWGGVISSYTIGVDNRFAFAAPIFGAGYISESKGQMGSICNTEAKAFWDAKNVLANVSTPTLFVNSDSDPWFSLNLQASSYADVESSRLCIINGLVHGHNTAFAVDTVYDFADSIVKNAPSLAKFTSNTVESEEDGVFAKAHYETGSPIAQATLYYTKKGLEYGGSNTFLYPWEHESIAVSGSNEIRCALPSGTLGYYIAAVDKLGRISCTPYVEFETPIVSQTSFSKVVDTSEDFSTYPRITASTKDVLLLDSRWNPYINIKDSGDSEHGKVLYVTNEALASVTNLRWGVKCTNDCIDITKGKATIEFDMKISDYNFGQLVIMPYGRVDGVGDTEQVRSDIDSSTATDKSGRVNQFCALSVATAQQMNNAGGLNPYKETYVSGNAWIQMRAVDDKIVLAQNWSGINGNYRYKSFQSEGWHTVKITIDKSSGTPVVEFFIDGQSGGKNIKNTFGVNAGEELMGVKFSLKVNAGTTASPSENFVQLDNFRFSGISSKTGAYMAKTIDSDGIQYDISAPAQADTKKISVYYDGDVNVSKASVTVSDGTQPVQSTISYDEVNKIVNISLGELLKKNTKYYLTLSGVNAANGTAAKDVAIAFTTGSNGKLAIKNLCFKDGNGAVINSVSHLENGQKISLCCDIVNTLDTDRNIALIGSLYGNGALNDVSIKPVAAGSMSESSYAFDMYINTSDLLSVKGFVWDGVKSMIPVSGCVKLDK